MLRFIVDTQLPPKLSEYLNKKGFKSIHTTHFPDGHLLQDAEIIKIAKKERRIIITKDTDFLDYFILKNSPPKFILIETGNINNKELFFIIDRHLNKVVKLIEKKSNFIIIQKNSIIAY